MKTYFHRVHEQSPTRLWINNPTAEEARLSVEAGAVSCTTNPTYAMKMHQHPGEKAVMERNVDEAIAEYPGDVEAAAAVQRAAVKRITGAFLPIYERSGRKDGFVSVQISPREEDDPAKIVADAHENLKIAPNIIAKIPTTEAGLAAMKVLLAENVPVIATEIMGLSQAVAACELYRETSRKSAIDAALYVTHISGIFDDYLKAEAARTGAKVEKDLLFQAGCSVAKRQYALMRERGYPGLLLGGGARGLHHFTEMVGGAVHVTVNWKGTAETLVREDPPVVYRMDCPVPDYVVRGLSEAFPDFRKACDPEGLRPSEFADYGPVVLFRKMFLDGWDYLLDLVRTRRAARGKESGF